MRLVRIYARVIATLRRDARIAVLLAVANILVAGLQFLDPILFGMVVQLLSQSDAADTGTFWPQIARLLAIWAAVGGAGIIANIAAALQAERLAHRNRLMAMRNYFEHVLSLPLSFHGDAHSGRLMKTML